MSSNKWLILYGLLFILLVIKLLSGHNLCAQPRVCNAVAVKGEAPLIDGMLNDPSWEMAGWCDDFVQFTPYEGRKPSQETAFKVIYDNDNLYIAVRAYDSLPSAIDRRLSRRDQLDGDYVTIGIDSYYDKRTAFEFSVNAAGVKSDQVVANQDEQDPNWDPIWFVKTSVDALGWLAEIRIPYSQLRFGKKDEQVWGIEVERFIFRKQEKSLWQPVARDASTWVDLFGELHGIKGIRPHREVEVVPYAMASTESSQPEDGNPYGSGKKNTITAGVDGKVAVTSDFTLNYTINPDFGQVEADPSEVNLTAFETFFTEKRPFFVEGKNIFNYQVTMGDGGLSMDNLFYSRRIGRNPHYYPETGDDEYLDMPEKVRILGAFKLSGKTRNGLSVGVLESFTEKTTAGISDGEHEHKQVVEPCTNYFVTRVQQDFNKGNSILGAALTATSRDITSGNPGSLAQAAYTGGLDYTKYWNKKTWFAGLKALFSSVSGDTASITQLQRSPQHIFQRPGRDHVSLDSSRRSLTGHGGTLQCGKLGGGHWSFLSWITWRSPGLELNDAGYMRYADEVQQVLWAGYNWWEPFGIFKAISINFNQWSGWDFGGTYLYGGGNTNLSMDFKNNCSFAAGFNVDGPGLCPNDLRGGPALRNPLGKNWWMSASSNPAKKLVIEAEAGNYWGNDDYYFNQSLGVGLTYRPTNALAVTFAPSYEFCIINTQYVTTIDATPVPRYIIARLRREMLSTTIRIDVSLTPDISLQYYGQPFLFTGKYDEFKRVTNTGAKDYRDQYHVMTSPEIIYYGPGEEYRVDEDLDGVVDYSFDKPDLDFVQFRSNLVFRWEFVPGSTFFLVWSQGRTGVDHHGSMSLHGGIRDLFDVYPQNVFLAKFSYRFSF